MYCIQCGVELQKGEKTCPLCGLKVYHPLLEETLEKEEKETTYPAYEEMGEVSIHGILFIVSVIFLIPFVVCLLIDLALNHRVIWSGYVMVSLAALYVMVCLPMWFKHRNPVIFFPTCFAAMELVALYVCLKTGGHWWLSFAFPVGGVIMLILETVIVLDRYVKKGKLFIAGGAVIGLGLSMLLLEFLIHVTFGIRMIFWSILPLAVLFLVGMMLIIIGISKPLRESLYKRFFI